MTRRPLRPLAGVIRARRMGEDPDRIEAHRRAERLQALRAAERRRAEWRLTLLGFGIVVAFAATFLRMAAIAVSEPAEPAIAAADSPPAIARADITDRNGRLLATNILAHTIFSEPAWMVDPDAAAEGLARIFPDLDAEELKARFARKRFFFLRQAVTPEQMQAVHDLGEPGLKFAPREVRVYPAGRALAHVLGATGIRNADVDAAELRGTAGVELWFDDELSDPARPIGPDGRPQPLALSIDLTAQVALREILAAGMARTRARGAAGVVLDARTGAIIAMVSLPDFDPNRRPRDPADPRLFNRAAQGVYELGSTLKPVTAAMVMERGLAGPDTMVDATPFRWAGMRVTDIHRMPPRLSLARVIAESSNPATARLAILAGARAQRDILERLGFFGVSGVELPEAAQARPLLPPRWSDPYVITVSFGHGIAVTPLHLAAAYATMTNGGLRVRPTLRREAAPATEADRVLPAEVSRQLRAMLRLAVTEGTGKAADVPGYLVGGKTGTAEKIGPDGRYDPKRTLTTFAGIFPADDPAYVVVLTLDEASVEAHGRTWRTAGWTVAPLAGETIRRLAPILGVRPRPEPAPERAPTLIKVRN